MPRSKVALSPIQRKAEFAKAATLMAKPVSRAAEEDIGAASTHLRECLEGARTPSDEMKRKVAEYVEIELEDFGTRRSGEGLIR